MDTYNESSCFFHTPLHIIEKCYKKKLKSFFSHIMLEDFQF